MFLLVDKLPISAFYLSRLFQNKAKLCNMKLAFFSKIGRKNSSKNSAESAIFSTNLFVEILQNLTFFCNLPEALNMGKGGGGLDPNLKKNTNT